MKILYHLKSLKNNTKTKIIYKKKIIGFLEPIGQRYLNDENVINDLYNWRKRNIGFFFKQEKITKKTIRDYLNGHYIFAKKNILFFILTKEKKRIGHIGISGFNKKKLNLDNLIRGEKGGGKNLITSAEKTILNWIFNDLKVNEINGKIRSDNYLAMKIHEKFGFQITKVRYLKLIKYKNFKEHIYTPKKESILNYHLCYIRLLKNVYRKIK